MHFDYILDWQAITQIVIIWVAVYHAFVFLQGTRAVHLLRGIIILFLAFLIFQKVGFLALTWVMAKLFTFFVIIVVVMFQPELREGLMRLGQRYSFHTVEKREALEKTLKDIVTACGKLARRKIGALVAVKRTINLKNYIESGVLLNAELSSELLQNIFYPLAPLHDGGVIIEKTDIVAAACLFPLSETTSIDKSLGMRHRAALGLSENSDALVIVVSEENGSISLAINGQLTRDLSPADLHTILKGQLAS
jgi:diadenylate cyclase